jgi:uncharacterized protein YnzC (UPF0291/DUF896 family)
MSYTETSLAIVEYKINELASQKRQIEERLTELIEIRDKIREEYIKEYEPCNCGGK